MAGAPVPSGGLDASAIANQATSFTVGGFPSSATAGVPGDFTVTATTASGTTASGYTGTVHFTSTDGQAVLPTAGYVKLPDNIVSKVAGVVAGIS